MAVYTNDLTAAVAVFTGYTTTNWGAVCTSITLPAGAPYNPTASKVALLKDQMKPTTATGILNCASSGPVNKHKYTGGAAGTWYPLISLARPTAYTQAMKVSGGTMCVIASSGFTAGRFWFDAYSSGGVRQTSVGPVTVPVAASAAYMNGVFTSNQSLTVPVGGYLVARISGQGPTVRMYMGANGGVGGTPPAGSTRTFFWNPTEVAAVTGAPVENRERFHDSTGTPYPDGTKVYEYDSSTMQYTGVVATIGGPAVGAGATDPGVQPAATGVGEAVFTRLNGDIGEYFYVIPDPASGATWIANNAYALNTRINPPSVATLYAKVTTAGTSGGTEPVWPTTKGQTVIDGTVTWTMVETETLCTDFVKGYQLGFWQANSPVVVAAAGPPAVSASLVAPAGVDQHAVCTTAGTTGATEPVWANFTPGQTVTDGTAVWTIVADEAYV